MANEQRENSGALFKNDTDGKSESFPGYGGSLNVDGVDYWISAWVKEGAKGKFFSLAIKPKEAAGGSGGSRGGAPQRTRPAQATAPPADDFESDSIPFITSRSGF